LLLTNVVPDRDELLRPARGALAELFPHGEQRGVRLDGPAPVEVDGARVGLVLDFAQVVRPPSDADLPIRLAGETIGYRRRHGQGVAIFLGASPWRAALSGDDARVAEEGQALAWRLLLALDGGAIDETPRGGSEVMVFRHGAGPDPR